ncbi:MAG: nucleotidyltransferase domain-containing protein [Thermodesulfobacteriota bacterium]
MDLADALFSKTRKRVLAILFGRPDESFYSREIIQKVGTGVGSVHRELEHLEHCGLVKVSKIGNQKHYQANKDSPVFEELKGLILKTCGVADILRTGIEHLSNQVKVAFVYGSIAENTATVGSDVDVMFVSDTLTYADLLAAIPEMEQKIGRTINPVVYSMREFKDKLSNANNFITSVVQQPKVFLIGCEDDIPTI